MRYISIVTLLLFISGCVAPFKDEIKTPYTASKARAEFIKNNITRIHKGMKQKDVTAIMGAPDEERKVFNSIEAMNSDKPVAYCQIYLIQRLNNSGSYLEKKEKCFKVFLDRKYFSVIRVEDETGKQYK